MKMDRDSMLTYIKQFNDKVYPSEKEVRADCNKIIKLFEKFGFNFHETFSARSNSKKKHNSAFYRLYTSEYNYIEIHLGYLIKNEAKGLVNQKWTFTGLCRVVEIKPEINPETGRPYRIGEVKHISPYYSVTLTKRGWYSGD
jgi:hypothetical protein